MVFLYQSFIYYVGSVFFNLFFELSAKKGTRNKMKTKTKMTRITTTKKTSTETITETVNCGTDSYFNILQNMEDVLVEINWRCDDILM